VLGRMSKNRGTAAEGKCQHRGCRHQVLLGATTTEETSPGHQF
jgi:hypothetical protein